MAEWTKQPLDARTNRQVAAFHKKHARALERMASHLRTAGINRVHFGLDFNNDEPDLSDYAVIEYADGRTEEQHEWCSLLEQDVLWEFPAGTGAYTFDAASGRVLEDAQGGVMDVNEGVSRAFHGPTRRAELEAEAEEYTAEFEAFVNGLKSQDGKTDQPRKGERRKGAHAMNKRSKLRSTLEPYLNGQAQTLEVTLRVTASYNDEWWNLEYAVRDVVARDANGKPVPFLDPKSGQAIPGSEFDWNVWLEPSLESITGEYANQAWLDDGQCFAIPVDVDEDEDITESKRNIIPGGFTVNLDGTVLAVSEEGGAEQVEEGGY